MEIHKPHAAKTWNEFFIELGTIVIGILIALGLEQSVDALHKRREAEEATQAVHDEMQFSLDLIHNRLASRKCIADRLDQVQGLLDDAGAGKFPAKPVWIGQPPRWLMSLSRWDFTANSGRLSLLPAEDQANYADLHRRIQDIDNDLLLEQTDWAQLRVFEHDPHITAQEAAAINTALQDARYRTARIDFSMKRLDEVAERLHISAHPGDSPGNEWVCLPFPITPAEAQQRLNGKTELP